MEEKNWPAAITTCENWLERFSTNDLRPQVEFDRAWATFRAGSETNALILFTNLVARFPTNDVAARAQYWVGSFYYNQNDYETSEKSFQAANLVQNPRYSHHALMMAGRAAIGRQGYADAEKYFRTLVEDRTCPPEIKAEAYVALGDTLIWQAPDRSKALQKYQEAFTAFNKIPLLYPTNALVPQAWGRIGDCYLQLATVDSSQYDNATNFYQKVILSPIAGVSARSQA